jgi:hypothetical protein
VSVDAAFPSVRERHAELTRAALRDVFTDQEADVVVAGRPLGDEWDARLAHVVYVRNRNTAADIALKVSAALGGDYDPEVMDAWLTANADIAAASINGSTREALAAADDKADVFRTAARVGCGAVRAQHDDDGGELRRARRRVRVRRDARRRGAAAPAVTAT